MLDRHSRTHPWKSAALWLACLAPFFFLSYRFAIWFTSLRASVPSLAFGWERYIPFLPWTIVPYWSTDLLYAVSLFICTTREELQTHAKRLVFAQLVSVAGFLLFPLRFSFPVPHVEGPLEWLFAALYDLDKPFNQAPSLHVSLTVILWSVYSRHLRGFALWMMRAWMILVGVSTLTTYQHHFIDLPTGAWVGLLAIAAFPFESQVHVAPSRDPGRFRLALLYFAGGAILATAAAVAGGVAWILLWPSGSLLLVAAIYAAGRPEGFRKAHGRIPPGVVWLLGPYLVGARLNVLWWGRHGNAADEIVPGVWLGRLPDRDRRGIASLVDLAAELAVDIEGVAYRSVPMLDMLVPEVAQLKAAVQAIGDLSEMRPTLVFCAAGYSRSAVTVAAWLIASGRAKSVDEAIAQIRARRPRVVLRSAHRARLEEWHRSA